MIKVSDLRKLSVFWLVVTLGESLFFAFYSYLIRAFLVYCVIEWESGSLHIGIFLINFAVFLSSLRSSEIRPLGLVVTYGRVECAENHYLKKDELKFLEWNSKLQLGVYGNVFKWIYSWTYEKFCEVTWWHVFRVVFGCFGLICDLVIPYALHLVYVSALTVPHGQSPIWGRLRDICVHETRLN